MCGRLCLTAAWLVVVACGGSEKKIERPALVADDLVFDWAPKEVRDKAPGCARELRTAVLDLEATFLAVSSSGAGVPAPCTSALAELDAIVANYCVDASPEAVAEPLNVAASCARELASNKSAGWTTMIAPPADLVVDAVTAQEKVGAASAARGGLPFEVELVRALTDFVVTRAKLELIAFVAEEVGQTICSKDWEGVDVRSYFPTTCTMLVDEKGNASLAPQQIGRAFQAALVRDLQRFVRLTASAVLTQVDGLAAGYGRFVRLTAIGLAEGTPLEEVLRRSAKTLPCRDENDAACGVRMLAYATLATLEDPSKASEVLRRLVDADSALKKYGRLPSGETLKELHDATSVLLAAIPDAPTLSSLVALVGAVVDFGKAATNALDPAVDSGQLDELQRRWARLESRWLAISAIVSVLDGLRSGAEPLAAISGLTAVLPCEGSQHATCTLKVAGYAVAAIGATPGWERIDPGNRTELAHIVGAAKGEFDALVAKDPATTKWLKSRSTVVALEELLLEMRRVRGAIDALRRAASDEERSQAARAVAEATVSLARLAIQGIGRQFDASEADRLARAAVEAYGAWQAAAASDFGQLVVHVIAFGRELEIERPLPAPIRKYVPLITALASAKSSDDLKHALEKYAEPVGGWRLKREMDWVGSVTAFIGVGGGYEVAQPSDSVGDGAATATLFAPIGLDLAHREWGAFLSLVDVGTLTSTRLESDDVELPELGIAQVFSPGLYLRRHFYGPLTIGAGMSASPGLREDMDATQIAWRALGFLAVDVTILTFRK